MWKREKAAEPFLSNLNSFEILTWFQEVYEGIRQSKPAPLPVIKANEWYATQSFSSSLGGL